MYLKNSFILIFFIILSCQPVEILKSVEIDTARFEKISINAETIEVNKKYNSVFSKSNIEDQIQKSPINLMVEWNSKNILKLGNENKLVINILDAKIFAISSPIPLPAPVINVVFFIFLFYKFFSMHQRVCVQAHFLQHYILCMGCYTFFHLKGFFGTLKSFFLSKFQKDPLTLYFP